jgi:hypothetical protein
VTDGALMQQETTSVVTPAFSLTWLVAALRGVASGEGGGVTAIRHPLGFICLPIQRTGPLGLCVHVWTSRLAQARPTTSAIHCHSWALQSKVLYGSVRNTVMATEESTDPTHRVYEVHSSGGRDELRATSRVVRCTEQRTEVRKAGDVYTLAAGVFHTTDVASGEETATVVFGQTLDDGTDLSLGPVQGQTHTVQRRYCGAAETELAARIVVDRLVETVRHA